MTNVIKLKDLLNESPEEKIYNDIKRKLGRQDADQIKGYIDDSSIYDVSYEFRTGMRDGEYSKQEIKIILNILNKYNRDY